MNISICLHELVQNDVAVDMTIQKKRKTHFLIRRGSCRNAEGIPRIGPGGPINGPDLPFLPRGPPFASRDDGPPCSLIILMATSGGAATKGPRGLKKANS